MQGKRPGVSTGVVVVAIVVVLAIAGIGGYFAISGKSTSSTSSTSSSTLVSATQSQPSTTTSVSAPPATSTTASSSSSTRSPPSSSSTTTTSSASASGSADFLVEATPNGIYIAPGDTINYTTITVIPLSANGVTSANLKVIGLSQGITASLSSNSVDLTSGTQMVGLTLSAASSVAPGAYTFSIDGTAGVTNTTSQFAFKVVPYLVIIDHLLFTPASLTVPIGSTVTWMNIEGVLNMTDPGSHNVTFQGSYTASSPTLVQYAVWTNTFTQAGTFSYTDTIHPFMQGSVTVTG